MPDVVAVMTTRERLPKLFPHRSRGADDYPDAALGKERLRRDELRVKNDRKRGKDRHDDDHEPSKSSVIFDFLGSRSVLIEDDVKRGQRLEFESGAF